MEMPVAHSLDCMKKALQTMRFGGHANIFCPSAMAFPNGRKEEKWEVFAGEDVMIEVAVHGWRVPTEEEIEERRR